MDDPTGGRALAAAVRTLYREGQSDYALAPIVLVHGHDAPIGRIRDGDAVIFCCRRGEREVQLTEAFTEARFSRFPRADFHALTFVILTLYHDKFRGLPVAFAPNRIDGTLGEAASRQGLRQLHVAESEKFAHVTFFLNGGRPQPFAGEDDIAVPSPHGVPFEQVPGLSLARVAQEVVHGSRGEAFGCGLAAQGSRLAGQMLHPYYDLIVANVANGDVIGHTSDQAAKVACARAVDAHLGQMVRAALAAGYVVLVTADHGNLEEMVHADGTPHVAHTANPVPFLLLDPRAQAGVGVRDGSLADVAPTVLAALAVPQPAAMTGSSLAPGHEWGGRRRVLLIILDGWGIGRDDATNPIYLAGTPVWDELARRHAASRLQAAGAAVGLQPGKAGNSEAGHMNIGAGRVVLQDDVRLDLAMKDGSFYSNPVFTRTIDEARRRGTSLHLIGLLTERSSHGSIDYPLALLKMARAAGLGQVYLHMITDGRSTEPGSAAALLERLARQVEAIGGGQIVTAVGRGLALDRDGDYGKTKRAYDALVYGAGRPCALPGL